MSQGPISSILVTIWITVRIQESEVRNPDSLDYRKSYQRILMKFYGELGCGLETNWLHFGDDPHHYRDPGVRSGSRSGYGKNCSNSIMLAFGGGLCSLSTSRFVFKFPNFYDRGITGVGLRQISLAQINSPTIKIPHLVQESGTFLLHRPKCSFKISKFSLLW